MRIGFSNKGSNANVYILTESSQPHVPLEVTSSHWLAFIYAVFTARIPLGWLRENKVLGKFCPLPSMKTKMRSLKSVPHSLLSRRNLTFQGTTLVVRLDCKANPEPKPTIHLHRKPQRSIPWHSLAWDHKLCWVPRLKGELGCSLPHSAACSEVTQPWT